MDQWQTEPLPLFEVPEWTRVIGVFDLETTGADVTCDRIVTAHVGLLDAAGAVVRAQDWLAPPSDALVQRKDPLPFARRLAHYARLDA